MLDSGDLYCPVGSKCPVSQQVDNQPAIKVPIPIYPGWTNHTYGYTSLGPITYLDLSPTTVDMCQRTKCNTTQKFCNDQRSEENGHIDVFGKPAMNCSSGWDEHPSVIRSNPWVPLDEDYTRHTMHTADIVTLSPRVKAGKGLTIHIGVGGMTLFMQRKRPRAPVPLSSDRLCLAAP